MALKARLGLLALVPSSGGMPPPTEAPPRRAPPCRIEECSFCAWERELLLKQGQRTLI